MRKYLNKLIVCTVGTSIGNTCPAQTALIRKKTNWNDNTTELKKEISKFVYKTSDIRKISAEMNSLDHIGISHMGHIVLLASSDNAPGHACAISLKNLITPCGEILSLKKLLIKMND